MPNFTPNSKIYIGRVPWDNSYRHTRLFGNASEQTTWMQGRCTQALAKENYTYVRMNNAIRVPFNAERLYTYNYVMYQNANYGSKWFYAFIVGVNYVNENATELVLELDLMQTWMFDYSLKHCFVEREHVNSDGMFEHLNPEPEMPGVTIVQEKYPDPYFSPTLAVVQTAATPSYGSTGFMPWDPSDVPNGSNSVSGGLYSGVVNGCAYYAFNPSDPVQGTSTVYQFLRDMNKAGSADAVTNIFQFPAAFAPGVHPDGDGTNSGNDSWSKWKVEDGWSVREISNSHQMTYSLDGYVPRNNKLFTYPYYFMRFEDNSGHYTDLKWELWDTNGDGEVTWSVKVPFDPDAIAFVVPTHYNGETANYECALTFPCTAKCSWLYSAYQNWSAQNHLTNTLNAIAGVATLAVPAAKGASAAAKFFSSKLPYLNSLRGGAGIGGKLVEKETAAITAKAKALGRQTAMDNAGIAGAGLFGLGNLAGNINRQSLQPSTIRGSANGNSLFGVQAMTYNIKEMCLKAEFAEIVDDFFDMYGYQVDLVKIPNIYGRASWNYVKCLNSCNRGNVPADQMSAINEIYNNGITFWHVDDIGNYSLSNGIVG